MDTLQKQMETRCKHFNGVQHKICEAGIAYNTLYPENATFSQRRLPCLHEDATQCQHFTSFTQEEIDAMEQRLGTIINSLNSFWVRETEDCPQCGQHVTSCEQVGRCVYARPCGCRVGQGRLDANWKV